MSLREGATSPEDVRVSNPDAKDPSEQTATELCQARTQSKICKIPDSTGYNGQHLPFLFFIISLLDKA